jgi:hypothetical protein
LTAHTEAQEASCLLQRHCLGMMKLLRIDEGKASADEIALAQRVMAVGSVAEMDRAMADAAVDQLFARGILFAGRRP